MKFAKSLVTVLTAMLPVLSWSQINTEDYIPFRDIEATDTGIVVTYMFRGGIHQPDPLHQGAKFWKIPGFGLNDNATEPGFPFRWDSFTIPDDAEVNVTLLDSAYTDTLFTLAPAYPPLLNSDTIGYTLQRVPAIAPYIGFYPNSAVLKGDIQSYRGQGIVRVATLPVQYNYQTGTVRAFSRIKYLVSFTDVNTRAKIRGRNYVSERADSHISLSDHFLENTTLNYNLSSNGRRNIQSRSGGNQAQPDNRDYLIISTPTYAEAVNRFAEWKRTKGFRTHVLLRNDWTVTSVKTSIMDLYNTEGVNLYYVLFVGNLNDIPAYQNNNFTEQNLNQHYTDYYYGCIEDTIMPDETKNVLPAIKRGRLPVYNYTESLAVINKIIGYEEMPPNDENFYSNAIHCTCFTEGLYNSGKEKTRSVFTTEEIRNYTQTKGKNIQRIYYADSNVFPRLWNSNYCYGDSIPVDLQKPNFTWDGDSTDILREINKGILYALYIGHGSISQWNNPLFTYSDLAKLHNGNFLPIVFSHTCLTGQYMYSVNFAKNFLTKENGGCVAIYANSQEGLAGYDDTLAEGEFNAIWPNPGLYIRFPNSLGIMPDSLHSSLFELGDIQDYALYYMHNSESYSFYNQFNNGYPFKLYYNEIYHLFGDPAMMIYTEQPITINHPYICVNGNTISVQTTDGDARISFYVPQDSSMIDSYLGNSVDYTTNADSVIICVDRHNCIPYIVTYHKNEFIQNENINDVRTYIGKTIKVGRNVTTTIPVGDVIIDDANMRLQGGTVELHPGTLITNSNVIINPQ